MRRAVDPLCCARNMRAEILELSERNFAVEELFGELVQFLCVLWSHGVRFCRLGVRFFQWWCCQCEVILVTSELRWRWRTKCFDDIGFVWWLGGPGRRCNSGKGEDDGFAGICS